MHTAAPIGGHLRASRTSFTNGTYVSAKLNGTSVGTAGTNYYATARYVNGPTTPPTTSISAGQIAPGDKATITIRLKQTSTADTKVCNQGLTNWIGSPSTAGVLTDDPSQAGANDVTCATVPTPKITLDKVGTGDSVNEATSSSSILDAKDVTYSYYVSNSGNEPLRTVTISDDKCASPCTVKAVASTTDATKNIGDTNKDGFLDINEVWQFTLTQKISANTVNNATATGTGTLSGKPVTAKDTWTVNLTRAFTCDIPTVYDAYNASVNKYTTLGQQTQGSTTFISLGTNTSWSYNAIAINPKDNLLYAISNQDDATKGRGEHLLKIDASGQILDLGLITGFLAKDLSSGTAAPSGGLNTGFFDAAGNYWVSNGSSAGTGTFYKVDLSTLKATAITGQTVFPRVNDWTYTQGYAWGISTPTEADPAKRDNLVRLDLATAAVTYLGSVTTVGMPAFTYGAAWTYGNGNLGFDVNEGGGVFQLEIVNPTSAMPTFKLVARAAGPASSNNDGTACIAKPTDVSVTKDMTAPTTATVIVGDTVTWTITASNAGPGTSSGVTIKDAVPGGFTNVTATMDNGTCTDTAGTWTCVSSKPIAVGEKRVVTITATAPTTVGTCFANTARVIANEADTTTTNNQDTTDKICTVAPPMGSAQITKTDARDGFTLNGATFSLYTATSSVWTDGAMTPTKDVCSAATAKGMTPTRTGITTTGSGAALIQDLKLSNYDYTTLKPLTSGSYTVYCLVETKAPTGYNLLAEPLAFTIDQSERPVTVGINDVVTNLGNALPQTGGTGASRIAFFGMILLTGAIALIVRHARRGEN